MYHQTKSRRVSCAIFSWNFSHQLPSTRRRGASDDERLKSWMSLSVSGVTPVFFTRSSQEEQSFEAPELYELATGEPDAREDPNPDTGRIGGELVEKLDVLRSDSPRQSEAAGSLGGAALLRRHRGDRLYLKQKEKSPRARVELGGHLLGQCWPSPGGQLR